MSNVITKFAITATIAASAIALCIPASANTLPGQQGYGVGEVQSTSISTNGGWSFPFHMEWEGK